MEAVLGAAPRPMRRIAVVGGGLSGLTSGFLLQQLPSVGSAPLRLNLPPNFRPPSSSSSSSKIAKGYPGKRGGIGGAEGSDEGGLLVIEKENRSGGWLRTLHTKSWMFELGPSSIRAAGPKGVSTLKLIERLNLQNQVIPSSRNALRNRYLWLDGRLQALPSGPLGLAFSSVGRKIVRAALSEITVAKRDAQTEDETIESFFARRFGPEFARTLGDALVHGIYAGHANRLSMQSCFPQLWEYEKKYGSVVKGFIREAMSGKSDKQAKTVLKRPKDIDGAFDLSNNAHQYLTLFMDKMRKHRVYSFAQGIDTLTNSLAAQLKSNLVIGSRVVSIRAATSSQAAADKRHPANLLIELEDGRSVAVDNVVSALPAYALAGAVSHIPELQQLLMNIPFVSVAVVHLAYKNWQGRKLDGFGHLVPSKENEPILGVQWNSVTFPQQDSEQPNGMRLTVMARIEDHQRSLDKAQWLDIACKSVAKHLGVSQSPDDYNIAINFNAIPQYPVGHARMVGEIERIVGERLPGLVLAGNSFYGVGINDSVHAAYNAVRAVERSWQS